LAGQQLGVKSVLVAPIKHGSAIMGVLEALSSDINAFHEQKLSCITSLAERVALCAEPSTLAPGGNGRHRNGPETATGQPATRSPVAKQTLLSDFDLQQILEAVSHLSKLSF